MGATTAARPKAGRDEVCMELKSTIRGRIFTSSSPAESTKKCNTSCRGAVSWRSANRRPSSLAIKYLGIFAEIRKGSFDEAADFLFHLGHVSPLRGHRHPAGLYGLANRLVDMPGTKHLAHLLHRVFVVVVIVRFGDGVMDMNGH